MGGGDGVGRRDGGGVELCGRGLRWRWELDGKVWEVKVKGGWGSRGDGGG